MRKLSLAVLPALLLLALPAAAAAGHRGYTRHRAPGVRVSVAIPGVTVRVGPWSVAYRAAARPGYRWVNGHYNSGAWVPGHYVPTTPPPQPGYVWVRGYWDGDVYIDGHWRPPSKAGQVWVEGYYNGRVWVSGYWKPVRRGPAVVYEAPPPAPPPTYQAPSEPPPGAPLALPQDYSEDYSYGGDYGDTYEEPAYPAPPSYQAPPSSGRRYDEAPEESEPIPYDDGVWGEPIEEEPLGGDEEVHHSLDW